MLKNLLSVYIRTYNVVYTEILRRDWLLITRRGGGATTGGGGGRSGKVLAMLKGEGTTRFEVVLTWADKVLAILKGVAKSFRPAISTFCSPTPSPKLMTGP